MGARVRTVEYFYVMVHDRPGEAYRLLSQLESEQVNLLAFNAIPMGPDHTQLVLFPDNSDLFTKTAARTGLRLTGPQRALLVQDDDRLGALADIHFTLLEASAPRSEEHTSELQSLAYLVCRLLLEKK